MKRLVKLFSAVIIAAVLWGCSTANDSATINEAGKHPAGWAEENTGGKHPVVYLASPGQCFVCHGNDLNGGISAVSCFSASFNGITCHPQGPSAHPTGFADRTFHGARAKAALSGLNGFAFCQKCHGVAFNGGTTPAGATSASCISGASACHKVVNVPHSPKPWRGSGKTHANIDQTNAPVCAQCHTRGQNLSTPVITTYASGTPGCFNSTLCHSEVGHAHEPRQPWSSPDNHGAAAKGNPAAGDGLALCRVCHGQSYVGNNSANSCFSCHQTAPHSPAPWRRTVTTPTARTHTDTNVANAPLCAGCHQGNQRLKVPVAVTGTPGCFDNSMCHGATGHKDTSVFPVPLQAWKTPVNHGARAKGSTTIGATGFTYCRGCHGSGSASDPLFKGGNALTSCMNIVGCHGLLNNAPHPSAPWRGTTVAGSIGHTTTDTTNDAICAICHTNGANSSRAPQTQDLKGNTGCFNATMCHGITGHADTTVYPAPWSAPANHGLFARTNPSAGTTKGFTYCQHCHGTDFSGGNAKQSCYPCHTVSAPHPAKADWTLAAGTLSHVNTGEENAAICANCHNNTTKNLSSAPVNYQARFAPAGSFNQLALPGCYNGSLCHADVRKTSNCDACHGPLSATVFNSLAGVTSTSDAKVGTHISHLNAATRTVPLSANIACGECHPVPSSPVIGGAHRNGTTDITFGTLAKTGGLTPTYSGGSCSNTYCHGATLPASSPARANPSWNAPFLTGTAGTVGDGSTTSGTGDCSKCHGYPPMTAAHVGKLATQCISCHPHVNASGTGFTDPTKHINGIIDASGGHGFPYSGATHRSVANAQAPFTNCTGCHDAATSGGTYPVAAGTAPLCSACHLTMGNFTGATPGCWDCHGATASDGRPNGTSFPNRQGGLNGHNRSTHVVACTVCHPFTAGDTRHGWSNRQTSSFAQVNVTINWNPGTRQAGTGSCTPSCHGLKTGWY